MTMRRYTTLIAALGLFFFVSIPLTLNALEEGEVRGRIERTNEKFNRNYDSLDYKGDKKWQSWGKSLKSQGWIVVQGDSGELKDYLLLVIDTRTEIKKNDGSPGKFEDLKAKSRVVSSYRMGYDALHADKVTLE